MKIAKKKNHLIKAHNAQKKTAHDTRGRRNQEKKRKKLNEAEMELRNKIKEKKNIKLMIILKEK